MISDFPRKYGRILPCVQASAKDYADYGRLFDGDFSADCFGLELLSGGVFAGIDCDIDRVFCAGFCICRQIEIERAERAVVGGILLTEQRECEKLRFGVVHAGFDGAGDDIGIVVGIIGFLIAFRKQAAIADNDGCGHDAGVIVNIHLERHFLCAGSGGDALCFNCERLADCNRGLTGGCFRFGCRCRERGE